MNQNLIKDRYLDLLVDALTGFINEDPTIENMSPRGFDSDIRNCGLDWPKSAMTMIGRKRLINLKHLAEDVISRKVPGDFIETGVWRGGACILLRAVLDIYQDKNRKVWVADSFEGLPSPLPSGPIEDTDSIFHTFPELSVSLAEVRENFQKYGLLDDQVVFLKGWFKDTLMEAPIESLSILRLDGDMYGSTMDAISALYPKLSPGGYIIVDDYHVVPACKSAITDYLLASGLSPRIEEIDGVGIYWKKEEIPLDLKDADSSIEPMSANQKYAYDINLDIESAATWVLNYVGNNKRVLDLGAGPGSITRYINRAGCRVTALERDSSSLASLKSFCEKVVAGDLNDSKWDVSFTDDELFDAVVLSDVLEHLIDPLAVLKKVKPLISNGGCLVVSLPHVSHAVIMACLSQEEFKYKDSGLLDRTHIRFFGLKDMQRLFEESGFRIVQASLVCVSPEETEFNEVWQKLNEAQKRHFLNHPYSTVYQVVIQAVPMKYDSLPSLDLMSLPVPKIKKISKAEKRDIKEMRVVAFHLPQFHPIPENNQWWGNGFTEWTNVTKTKPLFEGHYQPRLPADLGFYDLRLPESRMTQVKMAKESGIDAFCYHYYWFNGKRLLETPLDEMLDDPERMPFCLCWANENWTRKWDGMEDDILIEQKYCSGYEYDFIHDVLPYLRDQFYLHLDGVPFLVVYRPQKLPDSNTTFEKWRQVCREVGLGGLHVCVALTHGNNDYKIYGADSGVEFPPHNLAVPTYENQIYFDEPFQGYVMQYSDVARYLLDKDYSNKRVFRTVFPSWDNTPRVGSRALMTLNGTPDNYEHWLAESILRSKKEQPEKEKLVFINAWNEWAEGCYLEPDQKYGHSFLEATKRAISGDSQFKDFLHQELVKKPEITFSKLELSSQIKERDLAITEMSTQLSDIRKSVIWCSVQKFDRLVSSLLGQNRKAKEIYKRLIDYLRQIGK